MPKLTPGTKPLTRAGQGYSVTEVEVGILVHLGDDPPEGETGQAEATTMDRFVTYSCSTMLDEEEEDTGGIGDLLDVTDLGDVGDPQPSSSSTGEVGPSSDVETLKSRQLGLTILDIFDPLMESGELGEGAGTIWDLAFPSNPQTIPSGVLLHGANFAEEAFYQSAVAASDAQEPSPIRFIPSGVNAAEEVFYLSVLAVIEAIPEEEVEVVSPGGLAEKDDIAPGEEDSNLGTSEDGDPAEVLASTGPVSDDPVAIDEASVAYSNEPRSDDPFALDAVSACSSTEISSSGVIVAEEVSVFPPTEPESVDGVDLNEAAAASPTETGTGSPIVADEVSASSSTESRSEGGVTLEEVPIQSTPVSSEVIIHEGAGGSPSSLNSSQTQDIDADISPTTLASTEILIPTKVVPTPSDSDCTEAIVIPEVASQSEVEVEPTTEPSEPDSITKMDQEGERDRWAKDLGQFFPECGQPVAVSEDRDPVTDHISDVKEHRRQALNLSVHSFPTHAGLIFDLTCVACWKNSGPPTISCSFGHVICSTCHQKLDSSSPACPAQVFLADGVTQGHCSGKVQLIDEAVKKTPYFKYFMEQAQYKCAAKRWGCGAGSLPGFLIDDHEKFVCPFNFLHHCQFQREGCIATFTSIRHNLFHLVTAHKVPVSFGAEGHLLVRYGYSMEECPDQDPRSMTPVIRAIVHTRKKNISCYLMAEDMRDYDRKVRFTRIWFMNIFALEKDYMITAKLAIYKKTDAGGEMGYEIFKEAELLVLQSVRDVPRMEELKKANGMEVYLDIDHRRLDVVAKEDPAGKKYFSLVVRITFARGKGVDKEVAASPSGPVLRDRVKALPIQYLTLEDEDEEEFEGGEEDDEEESDDEGDEEGNESSEEDEVLSDSTPEYDAMTATELEELANRLERKGNNLVIFDPNSYYMYSVEEEEDEEDQIEREQGLKNKRRRFLELAGILRAKAQQKRREEDDD